MDMRPLGYSGLHVSALRFGCMGFGGEGVFHTVGTTREAEAERLVGMWCRSAVHIPANSRSCRSKTSRR